MVARLKQYPIPSFKTGLNTSIPPHMIEDTAVREARNVRFNLLRAMKTKGYEKFVASNLTGVPQIIDNFFMNDGTEHLIVVTHRKIYRYNTGSSAFVDITGGALTGANDVPASSDVAFDKFYFTNYSDYPQYWDGIAGAIAPIPALDNTVGGDIEGGFSSVKAKIIRGFSGFLLLGNTIEDATATPSRVRWSRYGDPTLWANTAAGAGQAGYADIGDVDRIVAMEKLKDFMVIYKERSIWVMQYVGPPAIFAFRRVVDGVGAISSRGIAKLTNQHIFVGPDGIYSFDGIGMNPISDRISADFFTQLNNAKLEILSALFIEEDFEILFPFVSVTETWPSQAIVYNYQTGAFGFRDLPATAVGFWNQQTAVTWDSFASGVTWDDVTRKWDDISLSAEGPINLFGDSDGFIYKMNLVETIDGADYEGYFSTKILDLGSPDIIKRVQRLRISVSRPGDWDLLIYPAALENPYDTITYGTPLTINLSGNQAFVDLDLSGRYFTFKIRTVNANEGFEITGMDILYIERGMN